MSSILIFVEQSGGVPRKGSLSGIRFGQQVAAHTGAALNLLVIGHNVSAAAEQLKGYGAAKVWVVDAPEFASDVWDGV